MLCRHLYIQRSHFYSCHTVLPQPHITTAVADITYIYIYIYTCHFHKPFFVWQTLYHLCAPLLLRKCSIGCYAARQHQHTRVHGYAAHAGTRAHRPRDATPELRRCLADTAHRTARHPRLTPTPQSSLPPPPMSSCGLDGLIGLNGALSLSSQPAGDTLSGLIGLIGLIRLCGESQQSSFFVFRRPSQPEPAVDTP